MEQSSRTLERSNRSWHGLPERENISLPAGTICVAGRISRWFGRNSGRIGGHSLTSSLHLRRFAPSSGLGGGPQMLPQRLRANAVSDIDTKEVLNAAEKFGASRQIILWLIDLPAREVARVDDFG